MVLMMVQDDVLRFLRGRSVLPSMELLGEKVQEYYLHHRTKIALTGSQHD